MRIESVLEKKRELEEQIKSANNHLNTLVTHFSTTRLGQEAGDWRLRLESLLHKHGNNMDRVMDVDSSNYSKIKEKIAELTDEMESRQHNERQARKKLADLNKARNALDLRLSLKELLALQDKTVLLQKNIDGLNQAVYSESVKITEAEHNNNGVLAALTEERENLLADIASGVLVESGQVEKLDKQIAEEEAVHEKSVDSMLTASDTISGLNRKIAKVEEDLSLAKSNFKDAAVSFIKGEIDKAGAAYVDSAEKLSAEFLRIVSMASICETLGDPVNVLGPYTYRFQIPSFPLDVCQAKECSDMAGLLFRFASVNRQEAIKKELDYFANQGLELPA